MRVLRCDNVCKTFETHKWGKVVRENEVLKGVNISINEGEIYGLLGLNGAGKTTFIRIISGILLQSSGSVEILDKSYKKDEKYIKSNIGVVIGGDRSLYWKLSARENLEFFGALYGMSSKEIKINSDKYLEYVGLLDKQNDLVETYSKGMKQRLLIAKSLILEPKILILDEPTVGLDIQIAYDFRKLLSDLNKNLKITMLLTTHYLQEAETLCSRIGILKDGRIVQEGTMRELRDKYKYDDIIRFEIAGEVNENIKSELTNYGMLISITRMNDNRTEFKMYLNKDININTIINIFNKKGLKIITFEKKETSLEDIVSMHF